jgi:SAM-dependent methyltransferase
VYRCAGCGLQFLDPQPDDKTLGEIYSAHYFLGDDTRESEARVLALKRGTAAIYLDQLRRELPMASAKLLELGCGRGEFLMEAQARGFDVYGVEYSPHATKSANERLGSQRVEAGTIEESSLADDTFDVCVFADVVEHVRDPMRFLAAVRRVLKPGGVVYIVTPSLDSWSARLLGKKWMEYKVEHLSYFGRASITRALEGSGFAEVRVLRNPKVLSLDYIAHHFKRFPVPVWSFMVGCVRALTPAFIAHKQIRVVASGMVAMARKRA